MSPVSITSMMKDYAAGYRKYTPRDPDNRFDEESVSGKIIIVTGCNTGLGKATVTELAKREAHIIMACRNLDKTREAIIDIKIIYPEAKLDIMELDLGDLDSVRAFAKNVKKKYPHINILINNAGISKPTGGVEETKDGFETHMGVNHLGHFLLTLLLLKHIKKGAPGRIVTVASMAYVLADLNINDLMLEKVKSWGPGNLLGYANSKLANMLFTRELSKRLEGTGVTTYAVCPGVVKTGIGRNRQSCPEKISSSVIYKLAGFTPVQGAQTTIRCATSRSWALQSGQMYRFESKWDRANHDLNEELGIELWNLSEKLVDLESSRVNTPAVQN